MAKIYGLFGSMTGKLADTVMSVRNGEQIARKYQPVVFNPSTPAQVATRAKLKLMSQLSAVMAPVIAIPRQGSVSSRNLFVKANYPAATYADSQADVTLSAIKITKSVVSLPGITVTSGDSGLRIHLTESAAELSRVVYAIFKKEADNTLRYVKSEVVSTPGTGNDFGFSTTFDATSAYSIYAYGVRDNSEAARVTFGEMQVLTAETVAKVIVSRQLTESDITLTETQYTTLTT